MLDLKGLRPDPRSTDELIQSALSTNDEDERWEYVQLLQYRGTIEVFNASRDLCSSNDPRKRSLGADVLGQLGGANKPHPEETVKILVSLLKEDDDVEVLSSAALASDYHEASPEAVEPLLRLKNHPHSKVRWAIASALSNIGYSDWAPHTIMEALIELASDNDRDVRVEATTSLAYSKPTTDDILEALRRLTNDEDGEVRALALLGLAEKKTPDAVDLLIKELSNAKTIYDDALDAAAELADPRLLPVLMELKSDGITSKWLYEAIEACSGSKDAD